jgi:hypothetical protein
MYSIDGIRDLRLSRAARRPVDPPPKAGSIADTGVATVTAVTATRHRNRFPEEKDQFVPGGLAPLEQGYRSFFC